MTLASWGGWGLVEHVQMPSDQITASVLRTLEMAGSRLMDIFKDFLRDKLADR